MKPHTLRTPAALVEAGLAPPERLAELERVAARYAVAITPALAHLMAPSDPDDPIARQFVPDSAELDFREDERADPIGDEAHAAVDGIVHRYPDRVLLKLTDICAAYCRFCFRRERVGKGSGLLQPKALAAALGYIRALRRRRHSAAEPNRAAARRQRRRAGAREPDACARRVPDQALLPASRRSCARDRALAHRHRTRPIADARLARPLFRTVPTDLRARYPRRSR